MTVQQSLIMVRHSLACFVFFSFMIDIKLMNDEEFIDYSDSSILWLIFGKPSDLNSSLSLEENLFPQTIINETEETLIKEISSPPTITTTTTAVALSSTHHNLNTSFHQENPVSTSMTPIYSSTSDEIPYTKEESTSVLPGEIWASSSVMIIEIKSTKFLLLLCISLILLFSC